MLLLLSSALAADFRGTVVENVAAGAYTYTRVRADDGTETWAAAPGGSPAPGSVVTFTTTLPMANFHSDALKRDFTMVYFVAGYDTAAAAGPTVPAWHPPVQPGEDCPPVDPAKMAAVIASAEGGAPVMDVGTVWHDRASVAGTRVTVRGQVTRFTAGVMGRNWIHLRDGTGAAGTDDLTITTTGTAAVGETIVVTGTVRTDQDFGNGYRYAVLVEQASVARVAAAK